MCIKTDKTASCLNCKEAFVLFRSPQRRTAGSTTETSTDHLKDLSRKIYVKSLGRQTYEHYYVGSLHTEGILSRYVEI